MRERARVPIPTYINKTIADFQFTRFSSDYLKTLHLCPAQATLEPHLQAALNKKVGQPQFISGEILWQISKPHFIKKKERHL